MRKQVAAANWKMNCTYEQGQDLLKEILNAGIELADEQLAVFAVPFPYLMKCNERLSDRKNFFIAAQNCHHKESGAYTGEVSAEMLASLGIKYCIVGHSERREYFHESNEQLAAKVDLLFKNDITPIFCCGESLAVREAGRQNEFVEKQIVESLFHLSADDFGRLVIAYEPIWAIGTGKTATTAQAQEIQNFIRSVISKKYGGDLADNVPVLYGGSVKANNAAELFSQPDVDGGLVGGASLLAKDFITIIKSLKN